MRLKLESTSRRILYVLAALLISACSFPHLKSSPGSGTGTGSSPSGAPTAFTPSSDARKDLGDALRKLNSSYPYRLTETTSATANGRIAMPESTRTVEFAARDRSHMKLTGGSGGDLEEITIGEKRYWFSDGKWTQEAGPSMAQRAKQGAEFASKLAEMIKEVKYAGQETVNGISCHMYSYTLETTLSGQRYVGTGKACVGATDGLPHQNDTEFKISNYAQKSHIVYEYNIPVKIEPPI